jgi:cytochrome c553
MTSSALALPGLLLALLAQTAFASPEAAAPAKKADLARGDTVATAVCVTCHSADNTRGAPTQPLLKGQHPEYLVKQLQEFKSGKRDNPIMKGFASALSDADMTNVAAFYAAKKPSPGSAKNPELAALGEKIYRGGIANRSIPACSGCHSPNGAGIPSQYPRLAGQHADYIATQLTAFRDGGRTNSAPMTAIAAHLSKREIDALADYIAGLR